MASCQMRSASGAGPFGASFAGVGAASPCASSGVSAACAAAACFRAGAATATPSRSLRSSSSTRATSASTCMLSSGAQARSAAVSSAKRGCAAHFISVSLARKRSSIRISRVCDVRFACAMYSAASSRVTSKRPLSCSSPQISASISARRWALTSRTNTCTSRPLRIISSISASAPAASESISRSANANRKLLSAAPSTRSTSASVSPPSSSCA